MRFLYVPGGLNRKINRLVYKLQAFPSRLLSKMETVQATDRDPRHGRRHAMIEAPATELETSAWARAIRTLPLRIWSMVCRGLRASERGPSTRYLKRIEHLPPPDSFYSRLNPEVMRIDVRRLR